MERNNEMFFFSYEFDNLEPGTFFSNSEIQEMFKCGPTGSMRRSLKTNSLVLISDKGNSSYPNMEKVDGIWHFVGMGRFGDQSLDYLQNKTLSRSNDSGVNLYLFQGEAKEKVDTNQRYKFIGKVLLVQQPFEKYNQLDEAANRRKVWIYPLIEIGVVEKFTDFISRFSKYKLMGRGVIEYPNFALTKNSPVNILKLMKNENVDTLTGPGGWFLTKTGHFYNQNAKSKFKFGNIFDESEGHSTVFQRQNKYLNPYYKTSIVYLSEESSEKYSTDLKLVGLRIESIKYQSNKNENIDIKFIHDKDINKLHKPFSTLIIGPNGTGKSTVLSVFQKVLLDLYYIAESKESKEIFSSGNINYEINYYLGKSKYTVKRDNSKIDFLREGKSIGFNKNLLPQKLIACAFNINDKFTYQSNEEDVIDRYQYLGIKSSDNMAKIGETTRNLVQNIIMSSLGNDIFPHLKNITNFIRVEPKIRVVFNSVGKKNINDLINKENIENIQRKYLNPKNRKKSKNINIIEFEEIIDFINYIKNANLSHKIFEISNKSITVNFDLDFYKIYEKYFYELNIIWHLYEIGIFELPYVELKKGKYFKLEQASSGEAQYFSTMVNILAKIQHNSVVVIDEPETSLHPNWQYKYIYGLNEIFEKFPSCHFIMATHSHFLISDLENGSSSIISMERKTANSSVNIKLHDEDTFGWAVEDVLFNIFGLPTNRNYYVADEIDKILYEISLGNLNEETLRKIKDFKRIHEKMKESDPLRDVLELIFKKVGIDD
ncbi:AAA family ATPase [Bacillus cereus]|uniref:AAA family ATPase n=2 Tax=Bacillus cereus TaxID=1396 RepID=UPI003D65913F